MVRLSADCLPLPHLASVAHCPDMSVGGVSDGQAGLGEQSNHRLSLPQVCLSELHAPYLNSCMPCCISFLTAWAPLLHETASSHPNPAHAQCLRQTSASLHCTCTSAHTLAPLHVHAGPDDLGPESPSDAPKNRLNTTIKRKCKQLQAQEQEIGGSLSLSLSWIQKIVPGTGEGDR